MDSISERERILRAAMAGVSSVARAIAAVPIGQRQGALRAAESSYLRTVQDLGYTEVAARSRVSAILFRLRREVRREVSETDALKTLYEDLCARRAGTGRELRKTRAGSER